MTLADIALYAYTHVADEGEFDLAPLRGDPSLARARRGAARPHLDRRLAPSAAPVGNSSRFCCEGVSHTSQVAPYRRRHASDSLCECQAEAHPDAVGPEPPRRAPRAPAAGGRPPLRRPPSSCSRPRAGSASSASPTRPTARPAAGPSRSARAISSCSGTGSRTCPSSRRSSAGESARRAAASDNRAASTSEPRISAPSVEPSSGSTACSGCGIRPNTFPSALQHARDVGDGPVRVRARPVAEHDLPGRLELGKELRVGEPAAVAVLHRDRQLVPRLAARREREVVPLDGERQRRDRRSEATRSAAARPAGARPR